MFKSIFSVMLCAFALVSQARAFDDRSAVNKNPIENMNISIYMPAPSRMGIDKAAIQEVSDNLLLGEVTYTDKLEQCLGYNKETNTLVLRFDLKEEQVYNPAAGGYLLGYSDPINIGVFWVSQKQLDVSYLKYISRSMNLIELLRTKEEYLTNAMSYTIAHEVFNHEIGIAVMGRPFQLDHYDEAGTLNSADPKDIWENQARTLSKNSAYLSWKRRKGYP